MSKQPLLPLEISRILDKVMIKAKPLSIFIYGSRGREDYLEKSDYEIGVLFEREKRWQFNQLAKIHNISGLDLFPFSFEDFQEYKLDTPFPKACFYRELIMGALTVRGKEILKNMKTPEIRLSDLLEVVSFEQAYVLSAVHAFWQKDWINANIHFSKSALFGARVLVVLEKKIFPLSYNEIYKESINLKLDELSKTVVQHAMDVRMGKEININFLYKNITFLNQIVYPRVKSRLRNGDSTVLKGNPIFW